MAEQLRDFLRRQLEVDLPSFHRDRPFLKGVLAQTRDQIDATWNEPELPYDGSVELARQVRLGQRVHKVLLGDLPDETPLEAICPVPDFALDEERRALWKEIFDPLNSLDRTAIIKAIVPLVRAFPPGTYEGRRFQTVGDVRNTPVEQLSGVWRVGPKSLTIIEEAFRRPEPAPIPHPY